VISREWTGGCEVGVWDPPESMQSQNGKTLGLIGLGGIRAERGWRASSPRRRNGGFGWNARRAPRSACRWSPRELTGARRRISLHLPNEETRGLHRRQEPCGHQAGRDPRHTRAGRWSKKQHCSIAARHAATSPTPGSTVHAEQLKPDHPLARMENVRSPPMRPSGRSEASET